MSPIPFLLSVLYDLSPGMGQNAPIYYDFDLSLIYI